MSAEIFNLRKARKKKARAAAESRAEANRSKFGEAAHLKKARKAETARSDRQHAAGILTFVTSASALDAVDHQDRAARGETDADENQS
jgi:hypothetical protein